MTLEDHGHHHHQHPQQSQQQQQQQQHTGVITSAMSQFQLEQSSVIKTAPPGARQMEFASPKNEPIDLTPLQTNLHDLSKVQVAQTIDYYQPYTRVYQDAYTLGGFGQTTQSSLISAQSSGVYYPMLGPTVAQQDWQRPIDQYAGYRQLQGYPQDAQSDRIYKTVEMPSPPDSGIGADLSLIAGKEDFFQSDNLLDRSTERALSHRDSPVIIPKLHNTLGFQYVLEAPISTSIRRDDDRMTYVNKGQFYTVSLDYIPDLSNPLKNHVVRSQLMIVFREDKTYEEEIKTWQFWHSRQHSAKQRILEVDGKNSSGMQGPINEIAHNAVEFCWNPIEQNSVKISIAVQCLSTDFSNQKGVKGLPLHVQIDTFDGENSKVPFHRGYCQIKVFCDKGAERKLRDEDKRAQKRRQAEFTGALSGRKKSDGEYHEPCERSEFYHMRELDKPAALFIAPEEGYDNQRYVDGTPLGYEMNEMEPVSKRPRLSERLMLYLKKPNDTVYHPVHCIPPTVSGLIQGIAAKFHVDTEKIHCVYKRCLKGVTVKMDDDMLRCYCNEDLFIFDVEPSPEDVNAIALTLIEVQSSQYPNPQ